ncbi:MAG: transcription termination factor Rho [Defluviitaleaceae bacterium]|nr:transcription termination factor Rho [Defluviitaleaceae bacterium]
MSLNELTLAELKERAKSYGIKNVTKYRKAELVDLITEHEKTAKTAAPPPAEPPNAPVPPPPKAEHRTPTPSEPPKRDCEATVPQEFTEGILEIMPDGYGFLRTENFLPGAGDIYVSPSQIRRFHLKTGDLINGPIRNNPTEKFNAIMYIKEVNGNAPDAIVRRPSFESLTPIFPDKRITLELPYGAPTARHTLAPRLIDLLSPIGFGQRGMIVSPPKAGKTMLLKQIANAITKNHPHVHLIVLLIDERPEEVTDMQRSIVGKNCSVVYSTFDEQPENHKRLAEMVLERAKRMVEQKKDLVILLDSITRLSRAYNLLIPAGGRTLSGGLDPAALYMPKKFFGAARNVENGGSLTILATALVETGSKMDDVIFEEFKGTGNMELVLDRKMADRRVFPAIDVLKSGTRREDLLLSLEELDAMYTLREMSGRVTSSEFTEQVIDILAKTRNNKEFVGSIADLRPVISK